MKTLEELREEADKFEDKTEKIAALKMMVSMMSREIRIKDSIINMLQNKAPIRKPRDFTEEEKSRVKPPVPPTPSKKHHKKILDDMKNDD